MGMFDDLKAKAHKQLEQHPDQVEKISDQVIERGGDVVDQRTGGKYADKVDKAQRSADEKIGE